jgi:hypothetical protein
LRSFDTNRFSIIPPRFSIQAQIRSQREIIAVGSWAPFSRAQIERNTVLISIKGKAATSKDLRDLTSRL